MWEEIFESGTWSLGGLLLGYWLGRTERHIRTIKRKVGGNDDA